DAIQRLNVDELAERLSEEDQTWLEDNREDVESSLHAGDVLLVICGDEIHQRVARLAGRFAKQMNPLSQIDVCMVAMQFYADQNARLLLVPSSVGTVVRAERDLTIRVQVVDRSGGAVDSRSDIVPAGRSARHRDEEQFFHEYWRKFGQADISACK